MTVPAPAPQGEPTVSDCPNPEIHGNPFRYCPSCAWTEAAAPSDPDLPAMAAYEAFCAASVNRGLGAMPRWDEIPAEVRADWRAVADAVIMIRQMRPDAPAAAPARAPGPQVLGIDPGVLTEAVERNARLTGRDAAGGDR